MEMINVFRAKTDLSQLRKKIENKDEDAFVIARSGKPVAMLVPYESKGSKSRIGTAKGKFIVPEDFDSCNEEIREMFEGTI